MLFHVIDDWVEFESDATRLSEADSLKKAEEIELGMYWLADNCDDDRLFVRSGLLVPSEVIRFALRERVPFRVSHAIYPSNQLPKDYFVRFEDQLLKLYKGDHNVAKIPILTFIGTLGKHTQQSWTMHISESMPVVFDYLVTKEQEGWQTYWYPVPDTKYYMYGTVQKRHNHINNVPINLQVKWQLNIKNFEVCKNVGWKKLVGRRVDAMAFKDVGLKDVQHLLDDAKVGGLKVETKWPEKFYHVAPKPKLPYPVCNPWVVHGCKDAAGDAEEIYRLMLQQKGMCIQGGDGEHPGAGTGKSTLVKKLREWLMQDENNVVFTLAYTNVAAVKIQGRTLHSMLQLTKNHKLKPSFCQYLQTEHPGKVFWLLVDDEWSMVPTCLRRVLAEMKRVLNANCVLLGDQYQR
eukprot:jgi/Chrzof1/5357/UNPLg00822.t1